MSGIAQRPLVTIAETLVDLARELSQRAVRDFDTSAGDVSDAAEEQTPEPQVLATRFLAQRRLRKTFLPPTLFHEPAWEALLALYAHDAVPRPMSLKELSFLVDAPFTTTQRWVDQMVRIGLVTRVEAAEDRRRIELSLTPTCRAQLDAYFSALATDRAA